MDSRKIVFQETAIVAVGEILLSAVMVGVFAAIGKFNMTVLLSALGGSLHAGPVGGGFRLAARLPDTVEGVGRR